MSVTILSMMATTLLGADDAVNAALATLGDIADAIASVEDYDDAKTVLAACEAFDSAVVDAADAISSTEEYPVLEDLRDQWTLCLIAAFDVRSSLQPDIDAVL